MIGLAARPGTDVEPTCSIRRAFSPSAPRIRSASRSNSRGHSSSYVDEVDRGVVLDDLADDPRADLVVAQRSGHASDGNAGPTPVLPGGGETEDATPVRHNRLRPSRSESLPTRWVSAEATAGYIRPTTKQEVARGMSVREARRTTTTKAGYSVAVTGDLDGAADQDHPGRREPASDEEAEQDNYANTDDQEA